MLPAFTYFFVRRIISTSLIITGIPFAVPISAEYLFSSVEKSELFLISFTFKFQAFAIISITNPLRLAESNSLK